jgi:hypothetical protein
MAHTYRVIQLVHVEDKTDSALNQAPRLEDTWGNGSTASHILKLGIRWFLLLSFTPRPPYSLEWSPCSLDKSLGGPQIRS